MTQTEISEHAKEALEWFSLQPNCITIDAIQHGINLAVESKDKRIAELEERVSWLEQQREFQIQETKDRENEIEEIRQSKDREIERLKADADHWAERAHARQEKSREAMDEVDALRAQLTEANAKLAEAEKRAEWKIEIQKSESEILESLAADRMRTQKYAEEVAAQLSSAQAEIERLKADASERTKYWCQKCGERVP